MKKLLVLSSYFILLLALPLRAQVPDSLPHLGDSAFASLITCGPGEEFYTSFGHSALRICDSTLGIDVIYNYGTFDFDTPHFYWKFARGYLNYHLSRSPFFNFLFEYQYEGRAVWQQRLRLSNQEVNNLFLLLEFNYQPDYRYYQYDFFRDNCATRPRDMIIHALDHRTLSPETTTDTNLTYRNHLYLSTANTLLWWRLAVDMALGLPCDHRCSNYEYMFSPIAMMHQFDTLTVSDTHQPLAEPAELILPETRDLPSRSISPTITFWVLFLAVLLLTLLGWRNGWRLRWLDIPLFLIPFLGSLLVIFLWFASSHYCTKANLNILWASPLFFYFLIRLRNSRPWLIILQLAMLLAACLMTLAPLPQQLNAALLPISLTLALRLIALKKTSMSSTTSDTIKTSNPSKK